MVTFLLAISALFILGSAFILRDSWRPSAEMRAHQDLLRRIHEEQREINKLVSELRSSR